jgi:WD40 repeat protein
MANTNAQKLVHLDPTHVTKYSSSNVKRGLALASKLAQPGTNIAKVQERLWQCTHTVSVPYKYMSSAVLSPNGKVLAVVDKWGSVNVWNLKTGKRLYKPFLCHQKDPSLPKDRLDKYFEESGESFQLEITPNNQSIISIGGSCGIKSWTLSTGKLVHSVNKVRKSSFNLEDGMIAYSDYGSGIVKFRNFNQSESSWDLDTQFAAVDDIALSPNGRFLAISGNTLTNADSRKGNDVREHSIKIWDLLNNRLLRTINKYVDNETTKENTSIYISPDSDILVGVKLLKKKGDAEFYTAKFWNLQTGKLLYSLKLEKDDSIKFSNNGLRLARSLDKESINIWQLETGKLLRTIHSYSSNFATSPDGQILASSGIGSGIRTIEMWNLETGELLHTLEAGKSWAPFIKFRSDSQAFVTIDRDGMIKVWQLLNSDAEASQEPQHLEFKLASESRSPFLK